MRELQTSDQLLKYFEGVLSDLHETLQLIEKEKSFENPDHPDYRVHYPDVGTIDLRERGKELEQRALDVYNRLVISGHENIATRKCTEYGIWPTDFKTIK